MIGVLMKAIKVKYIFKSCATFAGLFSSLFFFFNLELKKKGK